MKEGTRQGVGEVGTEQYTVTPAELRGLRTVRVAKDTILDKIKANRDDHRVKFDEAIEGYKQRSLELLQEHIDRIKDNAPERVIISLPWPEDHSEDYNRVIAQLELSLDKELELTEQEFAMYVLDQWGWKQDFAATYAMYTSAE